MTFRELSVVVSLAHAGRAVLPTLRSVLRSAGGADAEIVVSAPADEVGGIERMVAVLGRPDSIRVIPGGGSRSAQRGAGVAATGGPVIALLDAGDLVSSRWLSEAAETVRRSGSRVIARAETVVTFGRRSGYWPQPDEERGELLLPVLAPWGSPAVLARSFAVEAGFPLVEDDVFDGAWEALCVTAGGVNERVAGTAVFVRVWSHRAPWEPFASHRLPPMAIYTDTTKHRGGIMLHPGRVRLRSAAARLPWARSAARIVRSFRPGGRRRSIEMPPWLQEEWLQANAIEPLIPFPRGDVAGWYEQPVHDLGATERRAGAYWQLVEAVGASPDYVFFAPWLRTGGGDLLLLQYVEAVRRLDPSASILLLTTESDASTRLAAVPEGVIVFEARRLYEQGVTREDLVDCVLPLALAQWQPQTLHAFNSTVAFDVVEACGRDLAAASEIFLTSFVIDRTSDGERTSVFFLRPPDFLDPVRAVLVDSRAFVDQMTSELGYDPQKFRVVHQEVPSLAREFRARLRPEPPLRVVWAGRFDLQKRLDVLVSVVHAARRRGVSLEVDVYGEPVMSAFGVRQREELDAAGVRVNPPYRAADGFPADRADVFLMTSEWEGVPNTLLEAMSAGVPVVAPLVGGVGEVLSVETGFPVERFDDVSAYVDALAAISADHALAVRRASQARRLLESVYSREHFERAVRDIRGYLRDADRIGDAR